MESLLNIFALTVIVAGFFVLLVGLGLLVLVSIEFLKD
jgi:hypothetical protein